MKRLIFCTALILTLCASAFARDMRGRLGIGTANQFKNGIPALSVKIQRSSVYALGGMLGTKFSDNDSGYAAGLKLYRIIFDEPQLNFYFALMGAMLNNSQNNSSTSGFQFDGSLGAEFNFAGLDSLGFSLEFGLSANKLANTFTLETIGHNFINAAVHFYL